MWRMACRYFDEIAALWTLAVFTMLLFWFRTDGAFVDYTESYLIAFSCFAFFTYSGGGKRRALLAGVLMGCALLFKQTAACSLGALLLWPFFRYGKKWRPAIVEAFAILGSALVVNIVVVLFFLEQGSTLSAYLNWVWLFARDYGAYSGAPETWVENFSMGWYPWLIFLPAVLLFLLHRKSPQEHSDFHRALTAWLLCDFVAVNMSGQYFAHQFRQLLPALSLVCGVVIHNLASDARRRGLKPVLGLAAVLFSTGFTFAELRVMEKGYVNYGYVNHDHMIAGKLAHAITRPGEYVYVPYEAGGAVQTYSGRYSPVAHFRPYSSRSWQAHMDALNKYPPTLIIFVAPAPEWLRRYMDQRGYKYLFNAFYYNFYARNPDEIISRMRSVPLLSAGKK